MYKTRFISTEKNNLMMSTTSSGSTLPIALSFIQNNSSTPEQCSTNPTYYTANINQNGKKKCFCLFRSDLTPPPHNKLVFTINLCPMLPWSKHRMKNWISINFIVSDIRPRSLNTKQNCIDSSTNKWH